MTLSLKPLFQLSIEAGAYQKVGKTHAGYKMTVPIIGGGVSGDRINGKTLEGGSDWILIRPDAVWDLNVRLVVKTDDDCLIGMTYRGLCHGPADVMDQINRGAPVDPALYYFRTAVFFETSAEKYRWLNGTIAVGSGTARPGGPLYDVFEVL